MLPATNASSERSFSLSRLVKSYMRETTGQGRLNHLMIMSAYQENADESNLKDVARGFIHKNDTRISHKNIIIWEDLNVLTHFFPMFSLRFQIFKSCSFCSTKYGQCYGKHKIPYLLKHTRRCGAFQEVSNFIFLKTC